MCLIIHREAGKRANSVPDKVLEFNRKSNPDGFGIAWRDTNGLQYEKFGSGAEEYAKFESLVRTIDATEFEYVAHFRKATHGPVCKELSHPFEYRDSRAGQVLVFHNGIISIQAPKGESDTSQFVKSVLANMQSKWWKKPAYRFLVEQSIGWSRLLIMTKTETIRLNAKDWECTDGIFYSCKPLPSYSSGGWKSDNKYVFGGTVNGMTTDDDDDDDEYEEFDYMKGVGIAVKDAAPAGWPNGGHWVVPTTTETDKDTDDVWGNAKCTVCNVTGEYFVIEGDEYINVNHKTTFSAKTTAAKNTETIKTVLERDRKMTAKALKSAKESAAILLPAETKSKRAQRREARKQLLSADA